MTRPTEGGRYFRAKNTSELRKADETAALPASPAEEREAVTEPTETPDAKPVRKGR